MQPLSRVLTSMPLCSALLFSTSSYAVTPLFEVGDDYQENFIDKTLNIFGADGGYDSSKPIDMSYIPTAYYTPEKKFGIGLLVVGLYKTDSVSENVQPSSLVINSYYSTNNSYGISIDNNMYLKEDSQRFDIEFEAHNEDSVYYGIGTDAGNDDDNKQEFNEILVSVQPSWKFELVDNYYLGVGADISYAKADDVSRDVGAEVPLASSTSTGLTVSSTYDSRDYKLNASKGWLFDVDAGLYYNNDSDSSFGKYHVELSNYIDFTPIPGLLAWQVQGDFSSGDVPWYQLADLGGSKAMRGYIKGRYRDNQMLMMQAEYRLPIYQRYGMVFWGAAGSVADNVSGLGDDILGSVGTGFRVNIKDKINLRADVGRGKNETTFYINVNEVF
ncbi:outer membrane protein assembly factor [Vibrio sp. SS-MA-C1-2]|uniref:BamA/TamA family outer membrane protein n=1 Tax=Vibrio sp. SS-MA-C1-2 TaxID=2908646 RepID=UPI001F37EC99|nr:BamA/TamA family outer membrane protein [Vibrio sp. SS-MA-C1-2]UJF18557.1 outer membrane protein assembly factor [Vibrio sp. SS-MA-C1-2]